MEIYDNEKIHAMRFPYVNEEYALQDMGGGNEAYYVVNTGDPEEVAASVLFPEIHDKRRSCKYICKCYPSPLCVEITTDAGNYLSKEASAIIAETEEVRGDIENYDIATLLK